jgi:preprotein translocase subunit YajC
MEGFSSQLPFLLLMIVIFFFFIILPQQRRQKKEKKFMTSLKKGDRIISKSGMHGKIADVNEKDDTCIVETLAGRIKMERSAISLDLSSKLNSIEKK